jgi:ergothioneine biosynthesis protein EgtB
VPATAESYPQDTVPTALQQRLAGTRKLSNSLAAPLSAEDQVVQASDDASPTKWHLAHTTWFFETFVCKPHLAGYRALDDRFAYCFNSYYEAAGPRHPRAKRGLLTRPSLDEVHQYRAHVDQALTSLFDQGVVERHPAVADLIELGINHEQQHQELILTDILALFDAQPLRPAYQPAGRQPAASPAHPQRWFDFAGGIRAIGHAGDTFSYDNECPRHDALLRDYRLAGRLVTNGEWLDFMADGGYADPVHWLADGWAAVKANEWIAPGYWEGENGEWRQMTLQGLSPIDLRAPVCHVSYYEADAFARWTNKRLPTEFEWEASAAALPVRGNMLGSGSLRPMPAEVGAADDMPAQMFGDVWEWTQSAYSPYPGYRAGPGALGEYNGKFMSSQYVLKGASCVTPLGHSRATYRNFFYPHQRWQFTGVRLADDA